MCKIIKVDVLDLHVHATVCCIRNTCHISGCGAPIAGTQADGARSSSRSDLQDDLVGGLYVCMSMPTCLIELVTRRGGAPSGNTNSPAALVEIPNYLV